MNTEYLRAKKHELDPVDGVLDSVYGTRSFHAVATTQYSLALNLLAHHQDLVTETVVVSINSLYGAKCFNEIVELLWH